MIHITQAEHDAFKAALDAEVAARKARRLAKGLVP